MNFPISTGKASLFQILVVLDVVFLRFYPNSNRTFCEQTVDTLLRRHRTQKGRYVYMD